MDVSEAHVAWVNEQEYEWRRWAVAFVQLKRTVDQFVDGVLDQQMLYTLIEAIEGALGTMIEVTPETLAIILAVVDSHVVELPQLPTSNMVKGRWPTT